MRRDLGKMPREDGHTGRRWPRDDGRRDRQIRLQAKECLLLGKGVREGKVQKDPDQHFTATDPL